MRKIKTVKIKNLDGSVSDESYFVAVDAENVDMANEYNLQQTVGNIDVDNDGSISDQIKNLNNDFNKKPYYYNTVADMKTDEKLKNGDMAITLGYYEVNDGGGAEYRIVVGFYENDGGSYHKLNNNLYAELVLKNDKINIKQWGAYGDGIHDDTERIQLALNANKSIYIPSGIFYITSALNFMGSPTGKADLRLECDGTITFNHDFSGAYLFKISGFGHQTLWCNGLSFVHQSFLNVSRAVPQIHERTSFEGVVVEECTRVQLNRLTVVGVANRAIVINGTYEIKITNVDVWGGNLTSEAWYNTSVSQNLDPGLNSYYTSGIVLHGNDNILDNIVVAGFGIGLDVHKGGNMITNYHVWKFRVPLLYGIVARGGNNLFTNLYIDSIESNEYRTGAGIYELKTSDITSQETFYISSNQYVNVFPIIPDSTAIPVEMGDPNRIDLSENCSVTNIATGFNRINYRLYGGAIGNPNLDNSGFRNKGSQYIPFAQLKYDTTKTSITDILKSIIINYFGTHYGYTNEICFVTSNFNSYFNNGFQYTQKTLTYKIESCSEGILKCTIQGAYEWPVQAECGYMINRNTQTNTFNFYYYSTPHTIFANSLPSGEYGYLKGTCCICNNKPYWLDNSFQWRDANGNLPQS